MEQTPIHENRFFGKCFGLKEIKELISSTCVKFRCCNVLQKKMGSPAMYNIFTKLTAVSPCISTGASTREVYINFMETFLNSNPSTANLSYENGMEYLDVLSSKNFYLLESFFQVKIFVYEVRTLKQHGSRYKKLVKANRYKDTIYKIAFPSNICTRQSCFYVGLIYDSQSNVDNWPILSIVLTDQMGQGKNKGYVLSYLPDKNRRKFIDTAEPLSGLSQDVLLFQNKIELSKNEAASVGLEINSPSICLSGLIKHDDIEVKKLSTSLIIITPIKAAPAVANISTANINQIYRVVQSYNKTDKTAILIFRELHSKTFNILQSCYSEIKECYEIGAKNTLEGIKPYKFLKTPKKEKPSSISTGQCLCENFTTNEEEANFSNKTYYNFMNCFQKPIQFHPKSLPIHCQLFDLLAVKDFKIRIEIASKLSLAFFDIESLTMPIPKQSASLSPGLYLKNIDLQNMAFGYQKPFLIGYRDMLNNTILQYSIEKLLAWSSSNSVEGFEKVLHLAGNETNSTCLEPTFENACDLVKRFILLLLERAQQMTMFKKTILRPITEYLESLKKIEDLHIEALEPEEKTNKNIPFYSSNNKTELEKALYALTYFIEEMVVFGFNSSKFDTLLILPYLKYLLSTEKDSPFYYRNYNIFRKGRVISNFAITFKGTRVVFRDFLSIENPFTSLENMSRKYNVKHPKQVFPYGVLTSVKRLKSMRAMPLGDEYWKTMSGGLVDNEKRQRAARYFKATGALNMYEYIIHYLEIDVLSLCECFFGYQKVLYETEDWNITANKLYTISSLMYEKNYKQQFSNLWTNVAVFEIKNTFIRELLEASIMGGITTAMFRGLIGQHPLTKTPTGLINSHLTYKDVKNIRKRWLGLYNLKKDYEARLEAGGQNQTQNLIEHPKAARYVHSYDFMSLYASAMHSALPVGPARLWTYGYKNEENNFVKNCPASSAYNPHAHSLFFRNTVLNDKQEAAFIFHYLSNFNHAKYNLIMVRSGLHVGGQVCFEYKAQPDLFITAREKKTNNLNYFIINYDGAYYHGAHSQGCPLKKQNTKQSIERKYLSDAKHKRRELFFDKLLRIRPYTEPVNVFYEVYTSCDMGYCTAAPDHEVLLNKEIFFPTKKKQLDSWDIKNLILQRQIQGYIVVKGVKILEMDRMPTMGFCVQKTCVNTDWLSPATLKLFEEICKEMKIDKDKYLKNMSAQKKILCLHEFKSPSVLHTEYFLYLYENHLLDSKFQILHVLEFVHSPFLKDKVEYYIKRRFELKKKIQTLEKTPNNTEDLAYYNALSDILKLYNNSLYGFSLLKGDNYKSYKFIISHRLKFINKKNVVRARLIKQVSSKTYIVGVERRNLLTTTQAHIGSSIMFFSKILFLRAVQFILEHSDPRLLEGTYSDTDSFHFATYFYDLELNMLEPLRESFVKNKHRYFRTNSDQVSGVLDLEQISTSTVYICEKMYQKLLDSTYTTACKGVNKHLKLEFLEKPMLENPFQDGDNVKMFKLRTVQIHSDIEDNIINKTITKIFGLGLIPTKRFFTHDGHSKTFS